MAMMRQPIDRLGPSLLKLQIQPAGAATAGAWIPCAGTASAPKVFQHHASKTNKPSFVLFPHFFTCPETSLVISNMLTCFLPLKTAFRFSSALMRVFFFESCNPFLRM